MKLNPKLLTHYSTKAISHKILMTITSKDKINFADEDYHAEFTMKGIFNFYQQLDSQ